MPLTAEALALLGLVRVVIFLFEQESLCVKKIPRLVWLFFMFQFQLSLAIAMVFLSGLAFLCQELKLR